MKKQQDKISLDALKKLVKAKFGTEKRCADKLGLSKSNFSNLMRTRSDEFLEKLFSIGVAIPSLIEVESFPDEKDKIIKVLLDKIDSLENQLREKEKEYEENLSVRSSANGEMDKNSRKIKE